MPCTAFVTELGEPVPLALFPPAEIATHTVNHVANPNVTQILGAKKWLNEVSRGSFRACYSRLLRRWRVAADVRDRYLGVIEGRAKTGRNGATWQVDTVHTLEGRGLGRCDALAEMLRRYCELMHSNEPVHTWE